MPTPTSTARRARHVAGGAALVLFSGLLVPQGLVDPAEGGTGEIYLRAATDSPGALTLAAVLLMLSGALMVPAAAAVLRLAGNRGAVVGNVGAVLFVLGGFAHFAMGVFYLVNLSLPGGDEAEMVAFVDRVNESAALGAIILPLVLCFGLGVAVLPWAAWRAGAVHWWVPGLATAMAVSHFVLPSSIPFASVVQLTGLTIAYTALGLRVLRMSDAERDGGRPATRSVVTPTA